MRRMLVVLVALGLGACATTEQNRFAKDSVEGKRVAAIRSGEQDRGSDRICKSQPITGSRTMARVCYTRDEWVAMRRNGEEFVRNRQQLIDPTFGNEYGDRFRNSDDQQ